MLIDGLVKVDMCDRDKVYPLLDQARKKRKKTATYLNANSRLVANRWYCLERVEQLYMLYHADSADSGDE